MNVALVQIWIETCHQLGLGLNDVFQEAGSGVVPVAGVGVILHEPPAALGVVEAGSVGYQQRDVEVAQERDQTVTLDALAFEPLGLAAGGVFFIPEEADVPAEEDIGLQEDKALRDEFPQLLDGHHVLDAGEVGDAVVLHLFVGVLGQLGVKVHYLLPGVVDTADAFHLLGEGTLIAVVEDHDGIVLGALLTQGEDGRLGEFRGVEVDDGYGLAHDYSGVTSATRVFSSLVTRRIELLE